MDDVSDSTPQPEGGTEVEAVREFHFAGQVIRSIIRDGDPWFVAADVCKAIDVVNARDAVSRLAHDERGVVLTDTPSGRQEMAKDRDPGRRALVRRCGRL